MFIHFFRSNAWSLDDLRQQWLCVVQLIDQGFAAAKILDHALFFLDRYFLSVPALQRLNQRNQERTTRLDLITKA